MLTFNKNYQKATVEIDIFNENDIQMFIRRNTSKINLRHKKPFCAWYFKLKHHNFEKTFVT